MTINLSGKVGGQLPRLAPDLTFPTDKSASGAVTKIVPVTVVAGVLSTTLSLTGKHVISAITYTGLVAEAMTHKLTVDGIVIWNDVGQSATSEILLSADNPTDRIQCNSSILLEINTLTDTSITVAHDARPIL